MRRGEVWWARLPGPAGRRGRHGAAGRAPHGLSSILGPYLELLAARAVEGDWCGGHGRGPEIKEECRTRHCSRHSDMGTVYLH